MEAITSVFIQESREQLAEMEARLLRLEQTPDDIDNINGIFRAAHTIKGGAGVVECRPIVSFTHLLENLLDVLRNGETAVSPSLTTLLLECCDHMGCLVDLLAAEIAAPDADLQAHGDALTERLKAFLLADGLVSDLVVHDDTVEVETSG